MRKKLRKLYKYIGDEFNKKPEMKSLAAEFLSIDYKKWCRVRGVTCRFMSSLNMKPSDIHIVSHCVDYMQLLDVQGELVQKENDVVRVSLTSCIENERHGALRRWHVHPGCGGREASPLHRVHPEGAAVLPDEQEPVHGLRPRCAIRGHQVECVPILSLTPSGPDDGGHSAHLPLRRGLLQAQQHHFGPAIRAP